MTSNELSTTIPEEKQISATSHPKCPDWLDQLLTAPVDQEFHLLTAESEFVALLEEVDFDPGYIQGKTSNQDI